MLYVIVALFNYNKRGGCKLLKYIRSIRFRLFIISAGINYNVRYDIPQWKDTLQSVIINSAGIWILAIASYIGAAISYAATGTLTASYSGIKAGFALV